MNLSLIRSLTPSEVVRELLRLCGDAGPVERRLLLMVSLGSDKGVADTKTALALLEDTVAGMTDAHRRELLYVARRWVVLGQKQYGQIDLSDRRQFAVEALEEDVDAALYRLLAELQGRPDGLLDRTIETMRLALGALLRRELL